MLRRDELFAEVLPQVLDDPEITASLDRSGGVSVDQLRVAAEERRSEILRQTRSEEAAYDQAASRTRVEAWLVLLLLAVGVLILLALLAVVVAYAWNEALKEAPADAASVPLMSAAGKGFEFLVGMVVLTGGVAIVSWGVYYALSPDARAGVPAAEDRQLAFSTAVTYCFMAVAIGTGLGTYPSEIAWQLQHDRRLGSGDGYDWAFWVTLAAWAVFALPVLLVASLAPDRSEYPNTFDRWLAVLEVGPGQQVDLREQAAAEWREALRQALMGFVREQISERTEGLLSTVLTISEAPGLRQLRPGLEHVPTRAHRQLTLISAGMENGSVALSGPRGVGKTQLLSVFCEGDEGAPSAQLSLVESVPVLFDRREFMLHLFYKLCERVIEEGLGTAAEAERHKRSIRYLQTHSDEAGLSAGWRSLNLAAKRATAHAQQPQTYPEIVDSLKTFLGKTALRLRQEYPSRRLVIGIDELDRIEPASTARTFLNELKAVFDVPNCLFVLSVSDEALRDAELAPVGRRDAFDSAIDEVVRVEPLDQREAERVLGRRVVGLPVPFTALFYCLSGGMPRDLLRTARAAITYVSPEQPRPLSDLAAMLVDRELDRIAHSAGGTEGSAELAQLFRNDVIAEHGGLGELGGVIQQQAGETGDLARMGATLANRAYHLDTVLRIFTTDLTRELTVAASDPLFSGSVQGSFSALARAQREIGTADALARSTLQRVRTAWSLSPLPPVPPA